MKSSTSRDWQRALELTARIGQNPLRTLPVIIENLSREQGANSAVLAQGTVLNYAELNARINAYTRWALLQGLEQGDVVCLVMPNCPDYLAIWLGLVRIGCIAALINTSLRGASLAHVIAAVSPKHVILGASLDGIGQVADLVLSSPCRFWSHGGDIAKIERIDMEIERNGCEPLPETLAARRPSLRDRALYLYTSGTTGLPKAVPVSHYRLTQWSLWFAGMIDIRSADRMYNCLPMYHSVGGIVANCAMLVSGGSVVVRERFSASRFWSEIAEWDCTLFQYIGELCRYLVGSPPDPSECRHRIRLACGNGLRRDVWEAFQGRFAIPRILEFYASTEGNVSLYNCDSQVGSIGRVPSFLAHRFPLELVQFDIATGQPRRRDDGFCLRCDIDEPGEALGRIPADASSLTGQFEGYLDRGASEAKILRNVFVPGDAWYRTGDLMRRDRAGFYYFVDRVGDTFRWKGENVSTEEVVAIVGACPGVASAVVFGVEVPRHEGRAGMAAIVANEGFDLADFQAALVAGLPDYARPWFLRICEEMDVTGTFKLQKHRLVLDGYDPTIVSDPLFAYDRLQRALVPLDVARHAAIQRGEIAF